MNIHQLPNLICVIRIFLLFPIVVLLIREQFPWALLIFLVAAISDGVDGYLAKQFGWESQLGSFLDPVADKLLLISVYITCGVTGFLPYWLVAIVILRDAVIVCGAIIYYFRVEPFVGEPLFSSKLNTVLQLSLIAVVLVNLTVSIPLDEIIGYLIISVLFSTVWSGSMYIYLWLRRGQYASELSKDVGNVR